MGVGDGLAAKVFSNRQMAVANTTSYTRFVRAFAGEAAELWPRERDKHADTIAWEAHIDRLARCALADGLTLDKDVRAHIAITLEKGEDFWRQPDVQELLSREHLPLPEQKITALLAHLESKAIW